MKKNYNRNPRGYNQWTLRKDEEIQKIINQYPNFWTKKDFRGEGEIIQKKFLLRPKPKDLV